MSIPASSSIAVKRETIACFLANFCAPTANVIESTVGMAIGIPPTIKTKIFAKKILNKKKIKNILKIKNKKIKIKIIN